MSEADEGQHFKDLWAWADEGEDTGAVPPVSPEFVLGIMVVRDAAAWLPGQLDALARSSVRPGRLVAVDAASTDESPRLLEEARERGVLDEIVTLDDAPGFADAVAAGVGAQTPPWLWILHDDSAPDPDALACLLAAAPSADLIFPKLLAPRRRNYPDLIAECGQSITAIGQRVGTPDEGDIDQRQIEPGAVLGGSTAGMLVRGELWAELGGLAPELGGHRDGVDFGWRANLAGWRVVTAPLAALVHAQAGMTGERPTGEHPHVADRLAALRLVAAHGTPPGRLAVASWGRAIGFLFAKSPSLAAAELRALRRFRATKGATSALAERIPEGNAEAVADLLPGKHWALRNAADRVGSAIADRYREFTADTSIDELTSDEYARAFDRGTRLAPGVALAVAFLVAGVAAGWRLWGGTDFAGGGLLPAPDGASALWQSYLGSGSPALGLGAAASALLFGQPRVLVGCLLLLGPVLAALSANSLLRRLGLAPQAAAVGGGAWAASVLALGLPAAGDVTGLTFAIVAPLLLRGLHRMLTEPRQGAEGLRAPAAVAFWLFVLSAFWPAALVLATLGALVAALTRRGRPLHWAVAIVPAWLLMGPWLGHLFAHPGRLLTGVDPLGWPQFPAAGIGLLLGRIVPSGVPVWLSATVFVGLAVCAVWGLLRTVEAKVRWVLVGAITVPLVVGVALSRLALPVGGAHARALVTVWALMVVAGMIAAALAPEHGAEPAARRITQTTLATVLVAVTVCAWPFVGFRGPVTSSGAQLPAYVRDVLHSPRDSRALIIRKDERLNWNLVDARDPQWGSGERTTIPAEVDELVQSIGAGVVADDVADRLRALAISHVALSGFSPESLVALGNAEGIQTTPTTDQLQVFTVVGLVSRANVVDGDVVNPVVDGQVPAGAKGRTLTVAGQPGAVVTVGGTQLEAIDGEVPTYRLDDAAGALEYGPPARWPSLIWSIVVLAALGLLALPTVSGAAQARRMGEDD